jgi:hypothetical protein
VRLVVTNAGQTEHDFALADAEMQEVAEEQAAQEEHGHVDATASSFSVWARRKRRRHVRVAG